MRGNNSDALEILQASNEDMKTVVSWQQQRFHHLQSISLSLIGAFLTVIALTVTAYSIFSDQIPIIPLESTSSVSSAAADQLGIIESGVQLFLISNWLISLALAGLTASMMSIAIYQLFDIVTREPPDKVISTPQTLLIHLNRKYESTSVLDSSFGDHLSGLVRQQQYTLDQTRDKFVSSAIRGIASIIFGFSALYIQFLGAGSEIMILALVNLGFVVPAPSKMLLRWTTDDEDNHEAVEGGRTLFQELSAEDTQGRWELPEQKIWERLLTTLIAFLSFLAVGFLAGSGVMSAV